MAALKQVVHMSPLFPRSSDQKRVALERISRMAKVMPTSLLPLYRRWWGHFNFCSFPSNLQSHYYNDHYSLKCINSRGCLRNWDRQEVPEEPWQGCDPGTGKKTVRNLHEIWASISSEASLWADGLTILRQSQGRGGRLWGRWELSPLVLQQFQA